MKFALRTCTAAALLAVAGSAFAGLAVSGAINTSGSTLFSDNSAEQWIDTDGSGDLSVGDRLRGILDIGTIENGGAATQIGGQSAYNELTGIFDVVVTQRDFFANDNVLGPLYDFKFGAYAPFAAEFNLPAGSVAVIFEDAANNFTRENCTIATCEASATGGAVWAAFSALFWTANNAAGNPDTGSILPLTTPLGTFGTALDFTVNNTGFDWNKVNCVDLAYGGFYQSDFCGQGGILASGNGVGGADTPYPVFNNVDFTANAAVPEPGSMALVGLALLGLAAANRRRKV